MHVLAVLVTFPCKSVAEIWALPPFLCAPDEAALSTRATVATRLKLLCPSLCSVIGTFPDPLDDDLWARISWCNRKEWLPNWNCRTARMSRVGGTKCANCM